MYTLENDETTSMLRTMIYSTRKMIILGFLAAKPTKISLDSFEPNELPWGCPCKTCVTRLRESLWCPSRDALISWMQPDFVAIWTGIEANNWIFSLWGCLLRQWLLFLSLLWCGLPLCQRRKEKRKAKSASTRISIGWESVLWTYFVDIWACAYFRFAQLSLFEHYSLSLSWFPDKAVP